MKASSYLLYLAALYLMYSKHSLQFQAICMGVTPYLNSHFLVSRPSFGIDFYFFFFSLIVSSTYNNHDPDIQAYCTSCDFIEICSFDLYSS